MAAASTAIALSLAPPDTAAQSPELTQPQAEEIDSPVEAGKAPSRTATPSRATPAAPAAYRLGIFNAYPEVRLAVFHDDNVFYTQSDRRSDVATAASVSILFASELPRHALRLQIGAENVRYRENTTENSLDYRGSVEGRYDIDVDSNVYGGAYYSRDHEDRESPDAPNGIEPTLYRVMRAYGGFFRDFGVMSLRVAGTIQDLDFDDVPFTGGIINNDDRDRTHYTGGARLGYRVSPQQEAFVLAAVDNRRYARTPDDLAQVPAFAPCCTRDSNGYRISVGSRLSVPGKLKAEAYVGYLTQRYKDALLKDVNEPSFGANVTWAVTPATTASLVADRTVEETALFSILPAARAASSYVNTYAVATLDHRFADAWRLNTSLSFSRSDYQGVDRTDDYSGFRVGVSRSFRWGIVAELSFSYRRLDSSIPTEDFVKRQTFLRVLIPFSS